MIGKIFRGGLVTALAIATGGCIGGFESYTKKSVLSSEQAEAQIRLAGAAIYANNCATCHGPIDNSTKLGKSADDIQYAFNTIPQMSKFRNRFSRKDIEAISLALSPLPQEDPFNPLCETSNVKKSMPTSKRLSKFEYLATVEDLFGVDTSDMVIEFPRDLVADGFDNQEASLVISREHVRAFGTLADTIVSRINMGSYVSQNTSCTQMNDTCFSQFIERAGKTIFRRPVETEAKNRLLTVSNAVKAEGGNFNEAASYILKAMLQFPEFLYRLEKSDNSSNLRAVDSYEMASRLSYLIWQSTPDATLMSEADSGRLKTENHIREQVQRMLKSNKARRGFRNYIRSWLLLDNIGSFSIQQGKYPLLSGQLLDDMVDQVIRHYEELVFVENRNMVEAYTDRHAWLNSRLGDLYGVNVSSSSLQKTDVSGLQNRIGILSYPGMLMGPLQSDNPSIVQRGKFVNETFLCNHPPPPPPDVNDDPIIPEEGLSQRDSLVQHRTSVSCSSCHATIDGPGLAFDTFNTIGAFRSVDEAGNALFTNGDWKLKGKDLSWNTTAQFAESIADSPVSRMCVVEKAFQFGLGRSLEFEDKCEVESMIQKAGLEQNSWQAIMEAIALSTSFRMSGGVEDGTGM